MALTPIAAGEIVNIPLGQIEPDPGQPRKHFDEDDGNGDTDDHGDAADDFDPTEHHAAYCVERSALNYFCTQLRAAMSEHQFLGLGLWHAVGCPLLNDNDDYWESDGGYIDFTDLFRAMENPPKGPRDWLDTWEAYRDAVLRFAGEQAFAELKEGALVELALALGWERIDPSAYRVDEKYLKSLSLVDLDHAARDILIATPGVPLDKCSTVAELPDWTSARSRDAKRAVLLAHADGYGLPAAIHDALIAIWEENQPADDGAAEKESPL